MRVSLYTGFSELSHSGTVLFCWDRSRGILSWVVAEFFLDAKQLADKESSMTSLYLYSSKQSTFVGFLCHVLFKCPWASLN